MQRIASNAATDLLSVCHPRFGGVARRTGLAVADLCVSLDVMSALAEFFVAVAAALLEATIWLALLAAKPLRFLFSSPYRKQVRERWSESRPRQIFEFVGGSAVLILFIAVVTWWTSALLQRPLREESGRAERLRKAEQMLERAHQDVLARRRESQDNK